MLTHLHVASHKPNVDRFAAWANLRPRGLPRHGILTGAYSMDALIQWGGYILLVGIVFAETGLLLDASSRGIRC